MPNTIRRCIGLSPVTFTTLYDESQVARVIINPQTGTTYTLVLSDENKLVTMTNAGASTLTVPPNSAVAFPIGSRIDAARLGAGTLTLVQGSGVTITATPSLVLRATGSAVSLIKLTSDGWLATGDLQ